MTKPPFFPGFDGLMTLSRREGVDIRPTLLRVLTDLYVQADAHSAEEERQFVELTSRLIDEVDDATRAAVRARLSIYPATPAEVLRKLGLKPATADSPVPLAREIPTAPPASTSAPPKPPSEAKRRMASSLSMQPKDAAEINDVFSRASAGERALILHNLQETPLRASARIPAARLARRRDAGDGRLRRRRRELYPGARRRADPAVAVRRPSGQRSRRRAAGLRRRDR